jgi:hypothetical protein
MSKHMFKGTAVLCKRLYLVSSHHGIYSKILVVLAFDLLVSISRISLLNKALRNKAKRPSTTLTKEFKEDITLF